MTERIEITSNTIFRFLLIGLGFWFVYLIRDVLLMLFAAVVIAAVIEPVADAWQRYRIPRALSVLVVYVGILAVIAAVLTMILPVLAIQVSQLAQALPQLVQSQEWLSKSVQSRALSSVQNVLLGFGEQLTRASFNVFQQTRTIFSGVLAVILVFVIAFYMVVEKDALKKLFRILLPASHVPYVEQVIDRAKKSIGRLVVAQLLLGAIVGVVVGGGLWLLGVKYALALGLLAGVLEIVPVIGPLVAAIPGVLVGVSQSLLYGLITLIFYIVVQQIENQFLVPAVMRRAIGLHPLVTIVAVLLGARLGGFVGVILAVPAATIISLFWADLLGMQIPSTTVASPPTAPPERQV